MQAPDPGGTPGPSTPAFHAGPLLPAEDLNAGPAQFLASLSPTQ
eukprot:COSAG02_NODE_42635_length_382_cov_1.911661_1_plen_43_part_10